MPSANYMFEKYEYGYTPAYGSTRLRPDLDLAMSNDWYVKVNFVYGTASSGSLYYSYTNGTESWYNWSRSKLSKYDNDGTHASIIIDYGGVIKAISSSAFIENGNLTKIIFPNCLYVDSWAFQSCQDLTTVNLPNCTKIPTHTFNNCILLSYVNSPLCAEVGGNAFESCYSLTSINLPKCSWIWHGAFADCYLLSYVNLPLCNHIEEYAFADCWALTSIDLPNCSYVNEGAFESCYSLISVSLPNCEFIGDYVFYGCSLLSSIDLPNCTEVESYAFASCYKLSIVHLPKVTYISTHVFAFNTPIEILYMDQITSVPSGYDPLYGASSKLKSIIIPCSLVDDFTKHSIWGRYREYFVCEGGEGDYKEIFTATDGGGTITLDPEGGKYYSGTTVNIGYSANPGYKFSYFQYGSTPAYGSTVLNESFSLVMNQNWYVSVNFGNGTASGGYLYYSYNTGSESWYDWSKSTLSKSDNNGTNASIIIDYGGVVKSLSRSAFYYCSALTSIDLPNCTYVGINGFGECLKLTSVNLPNCLSIDNWAFGYCYSLSSINLPNCSLVGDYAFSDCSKLKLVNLPNCRYINDYAFYSCKSLISISLSSCLGIELGAFQYCIALESINLPLCKYVSSYAFASCYKLSIVHLPKVINFSSTALTGTVIETLYMDQITSVPSGGDPSINSSYIKSIFIPSSLLDSFVNHSIWSKYSSYFVCV